MAIDQILFDTTDAATIADSDKILSGILSTDGSTLITDTTVASKVGLDVYLINAADIEVAVNAEKAEDAAHSSGDIGNFVLGVRQDTLASSTSADGDYAAFKQNAKGEQYVIDADGNALLTTIDAVLDSIKLDTAAMVVDLAAIEVEQLAQGVTLDAILTDTNAMVVDLAAIEVEQLAQGVTLDAILVDTGVIAGDTTSIDATLTALSKAEDSVHVSGDQGVMALAVRNDAGTPLAADGDYIPFSMDSSGALRVVDSSAASDVALADTAIANAVNTLAVASTAEDIVASPLSNRKYLYVYNNDNQRMFVGATGVTASNGFPVAPRAYLELRAGAAIDIEYVSPKVGHEIRTLELS